MKYSTRIRDSISSELHFFCVFGLENEVESEMGRTFAHRVKEMDAVDSKFEIDFFEFIQPKRKWNAEILSNPVPARNVVLMKPLISLSLGTIVVF